MNRVDKETWARLSPRLDELLELPESERGARLAEIARHDAALAADLSSLLAQQTQADRAAFLEGSALAAHAELTAHATLTGQTIGAYTLERPLGEGGMSAVWLGRRSDGRYEGQVAVKFLNLALLGRGGSERFARASSLADRFEREGLSGSRLHLYVLSNLQGIYQDTDRDGDALALHARLEDALRAQSALDTLQHFQIVDRRATALVRRGRFAEAETVLRQLLERADVAPKGKAPAALRSAIGRKLIFIGATRDGIALLERALPELVKGAQRNQVYFALFGLIEANLMDGDVASASGRMQQLEGVMADGRVAARERSELARLRALLPSAKRMPRPPRLRSSRCSLLQRHCLAVRVSRR